MNLLEEATFLQFFLGAMALALSLVVITHKNPVVSAISLMGALFMTAGLYLSVESYFMGAVQILIYAGAIAVLIVFIVMLLNVKTPLIRVPGRSFSLAMSFISVSAFCVLSCFLLIKVIASLPMSSVSLEEAQRSQSPHAISLNLLSDHMMSFQAAGLLIFAAILGVVFLGRDNRQKTPLDSET